MGDLVRTRSGPENSPRNSEGPSEQLGIAMFFCGVSIEIALVSDDSCEVQAEQDVKMS